MAASSNASGKTLHLNFHGRIIDHLGIQMYQGAVPAVAEIISNAWDADATRVMVQLPNYLSPDAEIVVTDDGNGMTFAECQDRFLEVGLPRRGNDPKAKSKNKLRPLLGRKGIGKFAGFGIASKIIIDTVSAETGEHTIFELDAAKLRGDSVQDPYVDTDPMDIEVLDHEPADPERAGMLHGTKLRLLGLTLAQTPSEAVFSKGMARRFLLHQRSDDFTVFVNGVPLPEAHELEHIRFVFPRDYPPNKQPESVQIDDEGWGIESILGEHSIRWKFILYKDPIKNEEMQGITVFSHGKLAQAPFDFQTTGGIGGQLGLQYLSGVVEADFIDEMPQDVIAPERQRVDWARPETEPLLQWGRERLKSILRIWHDLSGEKRLLDLQEKLAPFSKRLEELKPLDRGVVVRALKALAKIPNLSDPDYEKVAVAVLTAWEGGRLHDLIAGLSEQEELDEGAFISLLMEAEVMTALHAAEIVKFKLGVTRELRRRVADKERENDLRDFISKHPWLISPRWDTFRKETSLTRLITPIAERELDSKNPDFQRRVDLVLSSDRSLVIMEFMRPGIRLDRDHIDRFRYYVRAIEVALQGRTGGRFDNVAASYLVADSINDDPILREEIVSMARENRRAMEWEDLISHAEAQWEEFFSVLAERSGDDQRVINLGSDIGLITAQESVEIDIIEQVAQPETAV